MAPPSPVDKMVPAAPTASHRSAPRQATAYNGCRVPLVSARYAPEVTREPPVPGAPGLACPGLPQPASPVLRPANLDCGTRARADGRW